jgi:hypothetical protein
MIKGVVGKGFLLRIAPRGRAALVCVLETDEMVYVNEVTGFVSIEAYGGIGFVATVVEVFAIVRVCKRQRNITDANS